MVKKKGNKDEGVSLAGLTTEAKKKLQEWVKDAESKKIATREQIEDLYEKKWDPSSPIGSVLQSMGGPDNAEAQLFAVDAVALDITTMAGISLEERQFIFCYKTFDPNTQDWDADEKKFVGPKYPRAQAFGFAMEEGEPMPARFSAKKENASSLTKCDLNVPYSAMLNRWSGDDAAILGFSFQPGTEVEKDSEDPSYPDIVDYLKNEYGIIKLIDAETNVSDDNTDFKLIIGHVLFSAPKSSKGRPYGKMLIKDDSFTLKDMDETRKLLLGVMCSVTDVQGVGRYSEVGIFGTLDWSEQFGPSMGSPLAIIPIKLVEPVVIDKEEEEGAEDASDYYAKPVVGEEEDGVEEGADEAGDKPKLNPEDCSDYKKGYDPDDEGCVDCEKAYSETAQACKDASKGR